MVVALGGLTLALVALAVGWALRRNALDDPYVTYRYAENLLAGLGPVYNPGEPLLSTTALGYGVLLAGLHGLVPWVDLPRVSNGLSALGLGALGLALYLLCARHGRALAGAAAALLVQFSPLLLSTFGLETCAFLGLVGWGALAFDARRPCAGAALLALATILRTDGALAFAVLGGAQALVRRRLPLGALATYGAIVVPYEAALLWYYGSPTPTTLAAKIAQATIGGWPGYAEGLRLLAAERVAASPAYWLAVPLAALGLLALRSAPWAVPLVAWGAAQAVAYQLLGVASYSWYYAPIVPAAALLAALGAGAPVPPGSARGRALATLLLVAPLAWAQLDGALRLRASVPEPRALAYEAVGRWLEATATPSDRVAVMEVGIMGYYARRPMVDLLGLIRPETISALRRQDFFWTIAKFEADWVVLTGRNPLWFQDAPPDHWFHSYYVPAHTHDQPGFWGTPLTVYRLQAPKRPADLETLEAPGRLGDALRLDSALITGKHLRPGDYLTIVLSWRALREPGRDYSAFVHVVNDEPRVIAQHDTPVIASRWPVGEAVEYFHPMRLPADLPPGRYRLEVGLYLPEEPLRRLPPLDAPHPRDVGVLGEITVER